MHRNNGNFPSENRMLEATYNVLDVMKMKRYFVSKLFWSIVRKNLRKLRRTYEIRGWRPRIWKKGMWKKSLVGYLCLLKKNPTVIIWLWFRNLLEKLENEDPGSRSWGYWSKTRWKKSECQKCQLNKCLWKKYKCKVCTLFQLFCPFQIMIFYTELSKYFRASALGISWYLQIPILKVRLRQNEFMKSSISKKSPEKFEGFLPWEFL